MYFMEWLGWGVATETPEEHRRTVERVRKSDLPNPFLYEDEVEEERTASHRGISRTPRARGPVYVFNDRVLELRCGGQEDKRGLVTILSVTYMWVFVWMFILPSLSVTFASLADTTIFPGTSFERHPTAGDLWSAAFGYVMGVPAIWIYFRYAFRFSRLEMLTTRHLLIRFNRITRQVHLHRPKNCGGLVTLPWERIISSAAAPKASEADGVGECVLVSWQPEAGSGLPMEFAFVGKKANGQSELRDEWEFIRRFMEDGPDGLPKPAITSHFPWPWQAFAPQFEGLTRYLRNTESLWVLLGLLLISPAFLFLGAAHWLSLLLCWKPRWPKLIREAGLPGKPVPPLTTLADYAPDIQQLLIANADKWALKPGSRPRRKPHASRKSRPDASTHEAAAAGEDDR